jgi:hypothetical protein
VYSQIQTDQVQGRITFEQACDDLRFRCESLRADDLLHTAVNATRVRGLLAVGDSTATTPAVVPSPTPTSLGDTTHALITTADKRQNRGASRRKEPVACLAKGCDTLAPPHLRLYKKCFHECGWLENIPLCFSSPGRKCPTIQFLTVSIFPMGTRADACLQNRRDFCFHPCSQRDTRHR